MLAVCSMMRSQAQQTTKHDNLSEHPCTHTHTHTCNKVLESQSPKCHDYTYVRFKEKNDILFQQYKSCCLHLSEIGSRELIWSRSKGKGDNKFFFAPTIKKEVV